MYQENNMPQNGPEPYGKRLLHMWSPLLLKWGIAFGVYMVAAGAFGFLYMMSNPDLVMGATEDPAQMSELYELIMKGFLKVATLVEGMAALITIPVMLVLFHKDRVRERAAGVIPNKKAPLWKYPALILMAMALCLGFNNLVFIGNFQAYDSAYEQTMSALYSASFPIQIVCLGVLIPLCEELVFRGLMFKRVRERAPFLQAALYSSFVFAFLHANMIQMLYGFLMGMAFCYAYEKYGSVKAPALAHIAANLLSVAATQYNLFDWLLADPMRIGVITVICASVASAMYVLIQRIEEKPDLPQSGGENEMLRNY